MHQIFVLLQVIHVCAGIIAEITRECFAAMQGLEVSTQRGFAGRDKFTFVTIELDASMFTAKMFHLIYTRDEDPTFFSTDPDPAQLKKNSGSDLKSK